MEVLLSVIIAVVVFGVFVAVLRFAVRKWFPEFTEYFQVLLWVALAALFIYLLVLLWPFLTGALAPHHPVRYQAARRAGIVATYSRR